MINKKQLEEKYKEIKEKGKHLNNIKSLDLVNIFENNNLLSLFENTIFNRKKVGNDYNYQSLKKAFNEFLEIAKSENILRKRKISQQDYPEIELFINHSLNSSSILEIAMSQEKEGARYLTYWVVLNFYLYLYELISKYLKEMIEDLGEFAKSQNSNIREKIEKGLKLTLYDFLILVGELDKQKNTQFKKTFEKHIDYQLRNNIAHLNYTINGNFVIIGKKKRESKDISFFVQKVYDLILFLFVIMGSDYGIFAKLKSEINSNLKAKKKIKKEFINYRE